MKVMVLEHTVEDAPGLAAALREGGHQPLGAADVRSASAAGGGSAPQLCMLGTRGGDDTVVETIKKLRTSNAKLLIMLLARDATEATLTRTYDAGLDLDLRWPASPPYLLTRLRVLERQFQIPASRPVTAAIPVTRTAAIPKAVATGVAKPEPLTTFVLSPAWQNAAKDIESAASKFLTLPAAIADISTITAPLTHGKQITLASTEHQIELRAAIGTDLASARHLAMHLFGSEEVELALDMLGEVANIFMGALKTSFSNASLAITGGLPADLDPELVLRPTVTFKHQESFALVVDTARLVVHLGMRSKANVFLLASALTEGMVLATDLHNARGMMLLSKGTRLSLSMIDKVKAVAAPTAQIEVMAP